MADSLTADLMPSSTIHTYTHDHALHLQVGNVTVQALVDTGAVISCISNFLLNKIHAKYKHSVPPQYAFVRGVGGETHKVMGCVQLRFRANGNLLTHRFHVLEGHHSMIIGMDFMVPHRAVVDLGQGTLTLEHGITLPLGPLSTKSSLVRTLHPVCIPPHSVQSISVKASKLYEEPFLIEPTVSTSLGCDSCTVIPTLVKAQTCSSPVMCRLVNKTANTVTVPGGTTIGIARRMSPAQVLAVSDSTDESDDSVPHIFRNQSDFNPQIHNPELSREDKIKLETFLKSNSDIFASDLSQLGCTNVVTHKIDTGDARPQAKRFYRASPKVREEIDRQINELLSCGFIEPSTSEWTSPVVLVKKKDGSYRFAVDYRQLNSVTKPRSFPMPRLEDIWDAIGASNARVYSVIDLAGAFWQLPVHQDSQDKTAFVTQSGQYRWTRMPFGLRNAPISFQKLMTVVFRGLTYKTMVVFIDDIICFSPTVDQHIKDLTEIFDRLRMANLTAKPSKCTFATNSVKYLGHILSSKGVLPNPEKIEAVADFPVPKTQKQVRAFLGLANYYRRFIKNYSTISAPLNALLKKGATVDWSTECMNAFNTVKQALVSPPVLAYPDLNRDFVLTTDASSTAIGYVLSQVNESGEEHPISYGGRSLRGAEFKYGISQLECLAAVEAVSVFHPYLSTRHFTLVTDHQALKYMMNFKVKNARLARWALALQGYDFAIQYKKGSANTNADALSRRPYSSTQGLKVHRQFPKRTSYHQ